MNTFTYIIFLLFHGAVGVFVAFTTAIACAVLSVRNYPDLGSCFVGSAGDYLPIKCAYNRIFIVLFSILALCLHPKNDQRKTIEEMSLEYEDEKNSMIAITETDSSSYEDFYDEMDNRLRIGHSMNMIFFGPPSSFLRLDPETILHLLIHTKKHLIPITRALLAWDIITDGKTAAFLQGREFLAFGTLLNVVPEEDLYYVNFGDYSVYKYFTNHYVNLDDRKYGVLVAAYRKYFGSDWYVNGTRINELGFLLCGFPEYEFRKITPNIFKKLNMDVLGRLKRCNVNQKKALFDIATHPDAYGEPYKWSSHEINRLNELFICIPKDQISVLELEAIPAISPRVMTVLDQTKLEYFTKPQILRMNPKTRRVYILRMQLRNSLDMSQIARQRAKRLKPWLFCTVFVQQLFSFY